MSFKPWKKPLLATFVVASSYSAATAQNVQSAQRAIELGRYNEARATLQSGATPEAAFELGRLYQFREMPDSAAFFFNKAASQSPMGMVAAGRALLAKGQTDAAEAQFAAAAKATKNKDANILGAISKAYAESKVKDITKAKAYLDAAQLANKSKDEPGLLTTRGDVYLLSDQGGGEAMSSYDRATMANPSYVPAYYRRGVLNVRSRNYNEAQKNLQKAVELDPSYAPAYRELADMYYYAGKYDLALSSFQKYISLAEKSPRTDAQYASFLYLTKKFPEALAEANKVLSVDPGNQTMNRIKAYSLYESGDYAGASAAMDNYLKVTPADKIIADDYAYQGRIFAKTGKFAEAAAAIDKAIAADPTKEDELQIDRANIYLAQGNYSKAGDVYQQRLKSGKGDLTDQFRYAGVLGSAKKYAQADSVYNIISTEKPTYGPAYLYRGRVNVNRDPDSKQGLAKPYYEKYIELAKDPAADQAKFRDGLIEANSYLGYYNLQKGDKAAALPYYEQVLALDPANVNANKAVDIIKGKTAAPVKKATAPAKKK